MSISNIVTSSKWLPSRYHGELSQDGDCIYFAVEAADEVDYTRVTTYANEAKFRELCAMFGVTDEILPNSEKGEAA